MGAAGRRLAVGTGLLLVLGLAWGLRVADAPTVFTADGVRAAGPDAYYQLRRTAYSVARFPAVLTYDRYLNHPHGAEGIWPPGLAWSAAALVRATLGADPAPEAFERLTLRLPVWIGMLAVAWAALWAGRRHGPAAGLVAGALLAVLPGHALYSRVGMFDHHALEPVFTLAFLAAGGALLRSSRAATGLAGLAPAATGFAAATALAFLFWPGLLLQLFLADVVLAAFVFLGESAPWRRRLAGATAAAHAVAAVALLPWWGREGTYWGSFAPVMLGSFQPWLLACAAAVFGAGFLRGGAAARSRVGAGVGVGLALLAASAWAFPDLGAAPGQAWAWLGRSDAFQAQVSESLPLFAASPQGRGAMAVRLLSLLFFATPVALWLRVRRLRRDAEPGAEGWLLVALVVGLGAAALAQRRFANAFSVPLALLWGWLVGAWLPAAFAARGVGPAARAGGAAAVAFVVLLALAPILAVHGPALERRASVAERRPPRLAADVWRRHELHALAEWLRDATPPTRGFLDPTLVPEYGVLGHWTNGHVLEYVARRPTVVTNFGDDLGEENWEAANRYFGVAEPEASAILDALRVRYVLLEWRPQAPLTVFGPDSMVARGFFGDGGAATRSRAREAGTPREVPGDYPAFERHRLVQETGPKPWAPEQPFFKVYEHVAGARVEGRAAPGARVELALDLATSRGRRFTWRSEARADDAGRWRVRVPYATRGAPPAVRAEGAYRVSTGDRTAPLTVTEADVQEGRTVAGPDLRADHDASDAAPDHRAAR